MEANIENPQGEGGVANNEGNPQSQHPHVVVDAQNGNVNPPPNPQPFPNVQPGGYYQGYNPYPYPPHQPNPYPYPPNQLKSCGLQFCRFAFVVAFLLLLSGAALNSQHTEDNFYFGYCYVVKPGLFCGAAVLSLLSVILGIIYYLTLSSAKNTNNRWGPPVPPPPTQGGIAMGQPQIPSQGPVFVHEDTYMRRQEAL